MRRLPDALQNPFVTSVAIVSLALRIREPAQTVFTALSARFPFPANISANGQTLSGDGLFLSGDDFSTLGLKAVKGRLLGPDDDKSPGESPVLVLSHAHWTSRFGNNPAILNRSTARAQTASPA